MRTENFTIEEYKCKCGCGLMSISPTIMLINQLVRNHFKSPVTISSGCRCDTYNKKVGGKPLSQHKLKGDDMTHASDIQIKGVKPIEAFNFLDGLFPNALGLGLYDTFLHIDDRMDKAYRWDNRSKK